MEERAKKSLKNDHIHQSNCMGNVCVFSLAPGFSPGKNGGRVVKNLRLPYVLNLPVVSSALPCSKSVFGTDLFDISVRIDALFSRQAAWAWESCSHLF